MQKVIITILFSLTLAISAQAQVSVPQEFVDRATQAFKEVKALRELAAAQKDAIDSKNQLIKIKDEQIKALTAIKCQVTEFKFLFVIRKKRCF